MGSMSYCRFENTYSDLQECYDDLTRDGVRGKMENSSEYEKPNVIGVIDLCKQIVDEFEDEAEECRELL